MTWSELKQTVALKGFVDQGSIADLETLTYGGPTDRLMQRYFQNYVMAAREVYVPVATLTLALNDQEFSLADPLNSNKPLFLVGRVWIGGTEVQAYDMHALQQNWPQNGTLVAGRPQGWAMLRDFRIFFNVPVSAAVAAETGHRANGFASHPPIASDADTLQIAFTSEDVAADYVYLNLAQSVASSQAEAARLQSYAETVRGHVSRLAARQKQLLDMADRITVPMGMNA